MKPDFSPTRRNFLKIAGATALLPASLRADHHGKKPLFEISLAEWSLHRTIRSGKLTNLDFPAKAKEMGIGAVEYVNQFFKDKAQDRDYLKQLKMRVDDAGSKSLLIMCDGEGRLGIRIPPAASSSSATATQAFLTANTPRLVC